mmetsp:Transcript_15113/g.34837  ORF Transcript_15113/g.34837 Transcript_15113/m.34837 type:complete len:139 (+) Transcript_15113:27-443(+)
MPNAECRVVNCQVIDRWMIVVYSIQRGNRIDPAFLQLHSHSGSNQPANQDSTIFAVSAVCKRRIEWTNCCLTLSVWTVLTIAALYTTGQKLKKEAFLGTRPARPSSPTAYCLRIRVSPSPFSAGALSHRAQLCHLHHI